MKTTRRGLFAWLGALTGAAAVSRVAVAKDWPLTGAHPESAEMLKRAGVKPVFEHVATNPDWRDEYCAQLGARWAEESEAMRAGRLLAEQHARDIEAGRELRTPEDVIEMLKLAPMPDDARAAMEAHRKELQSLYGKPVRLSREHGITEPTTSKAFTLADECDECRAKPGSPALCADCLRRRDGHPRVSYGSLDERCPGHRRGCDLGMGHAPYSKCSGYEPGSGGWTIGDLKSEAT